MVYKIIMTKMSNNMFDTSMTYPVHILFVNGRNLSIPCSKQNFPMQYLSNDPHLINKSIQQNKLMY